MSYRLVTPSLHLSVLVAREIEARVRFTGVGTPDDELAERVFELVENARAVMTRDELREAWTYASDIAWDLAATWADESSAPDRPAFVIRHGVTRGWC